MVDSVPMTRLPAVSMERSPADTGRRAAREPQDDGFDKELARHGNAERDPRDVQVRKESAQVPEDEEPEPGMTSGEPRSTHATLPVLDVLLAQAVQLHSPAGYQKGKSRDETALDGNESEEHAPLKPPKRIDSDSKGKATIRLIEPTAEPGEAKPLVTVRASGPVQPQQEQAAPGASPEHIPNRIRERDAGIDSASGKVTGHEAPPLEAPVSATVSPSAQQTAVDRAPAEQILDQLLAPAKAMASETPSPKPLLKTLQFEFKPEALGTVQVTLRLVGSKMEIEIAPRERETESLLRADARLVDQVVRAVTAAGDLSSVTVNIASRETGDAGAGNWAGTFGNESQQSHQRANSEGDGSSSQRDEVKTHAQSKVEQSENDMPSRQSFLRPRVV